ncbi:MAG: ABC-2 family transporter protein [Verrucomicrobia bacterium]|nr:ABC-2 family transporter protein [Verrucomicrobiota bacterium]
MISRKYAKVFEIGLQNTFVYRWNFFLRACFGLVPLLGTVFIWGAIFEAKGGSAFNDFDYSSVIFYFLLVMFLDGLITPADDEWQVAAEIRDGLINNFLIKPVGYLPYRFCLFSSTRILYTVVTLPVLVVIFFVFRQYVHWPGRPEIWICAGVSVGMAALLQFLISFCVAMLAFWMLEISTVVFILYSFEYFLSGHLFPLGLFPAWIQRLLAFSPFPYELYFPIAVFQQKVDGVAAYRGLAIQAFWVLAMAVAAQGLWNRGLRKYQAVGG